jgi:hypothetical protein
MEFTYILVGRHYSFGLLAGRGIAVQGVAKVSHKSSA